MSASSSVPAEPAPPEPASSFRSARTLFRVRGVPVRIDGSWFLVAGLVLVYLYERLGAALSGHSGLTVIAAAIVATLLFFASILCHELGHAWASLDRGIPVTGITLFMMGGVTESAREAGSARDEFVIVGIGPFVSLVLAALFGLITIVVRPSPLVGAVTGYLGWINFALAVFNILPGYPLDGGRILRSVLWGVTGRPQQATRWAARVGQVFAAGLVVWGASQLLTGQASGGFGSLWWIVLGMFLFRGAKDAHDRAEQRELLARLTVRAQMGSVPQTLDPDMPLPEAALRMRQRPSLPWPVGAPLVGVMLLERINAAADWRLLSVREVMLPPEGRTVTADTPMDTALDALSRAPEQVLVVTDGGRAVGLLTPSLVADR